MDWFHFDAAMDVELAGMYVCCFDMDSPKALTLGAPAKSVNFQGLIFDYGTCKNLKACDLSNKHI